MPFHEKSTPLANYPNPIFQFSERVVSFSFIVVNTNTAVESPVLYFVQVYVTGADSVLPVWIFEEHTSSSSLK
ncbi:unnamed protein product [Lactuca virosa]|uniref:Uncharacterized protein n=1 Tax=Lactuca virosa TaxID=75947 RepID=A0AAU9PBY7_9ASTR|nr:unnamed protein product [Lactuca virosa]